MAANLLGGHRALHGRCAQHHPLLERVHQRTVKAARSNPPRVLKRPSNHPFHRREDPLLAVESRSLLPHHDLEATILPLQVRHHARGLLGARRVWDHHRLAVNHRRHRTVAGPKVDPNTPPLDLIPAFRPPLTLILLTLLAHPQPSRRPTTQASSHRSPGSPPCEGWGEVGGQSPTPARDPCTTAGCVAGCCHRRRKGES
mmetsp:Transcript_34735/g.81438  ORF Transcript_34735/g.81438 Transcript_34735/m.81438 type:complete len:200 (+) Transcript_34735:134-733(+)